MTNLPIPTPHHSWCHLQPHPSSCEICAFYFTSFFFPGSSLPVQQELADGADASQRRSEEFISPYFFFLFPQLSFSLQSKGPVVWEEATKANPGRKTEIVRKKCYSADDLRPPCALHSSALPLPWHFPVSIN